MRFVVATALLAASLVPAAAQNVGSVGAVNQSATGTPPGRAARALSIGLPVVGREKIQTAAEGSAQIVFLDTSTMNIGRNSTVTIDRFAYDPAAGAGEQAVSVTKGVMRFIGGGVSHNQGMSVRTPVATVGIRGGAATVSVSGRCPSLVVNQNGVTTVANNVSAVTISQNNYSVCVTGPNAQIAPPLPLPSDMLGNLMGSLTSGPGQSGGLPTPPSSQQMLNAGVGNTRRGFDPDPSLVIQGDDIGRSGQPGRNTSEPNYCYPGSSFCL